MHRKAAARAALNQSHVRLRPGSSSFRQKQLEPSVVTLSQFGSAILESIETFELLKSLCRRGRLDRVPGCDKNRFSASR